VGREQWAIGYDDERSSQSIQWRRWGIPWAKKSGTEYGLDFAIASDAKSEGIMYAVSSAINRIRTLPINSKVIIGLLYFNTPHKKFNCRGL
jgi:hypothetical protein